MKFFSLLVLPFVIYFSYSYTKPLDSYYHHALRTELEYLSLDKKPEFTKSKLIVYETGKIKLDFFVENKRQRNALAIIDINNRKKITLPLINEKHTIYLLKVKRGDYLQIDIKKTNFNKDDSVILNLQYMAYYNYYQDLLIILFWIFFGIIALKRFFFINFLLVYTTYLFMLYSEQVAFGSLSLFSNVAYLFLSLAIFGLSSLIRAFIRNNSIRIFLIFLIYFITLLPFVMSDLYCSSTSSMISKQVIDALLQTNLEESSAYIKDFMDITLFFSFILFYILIFYLVVKAKNEKVSFKEIDYVYFIAILLFLLFNFRALHLYGMFISTVNDFSNQEIKYEKLVKNRTTDIKHLYSVKQGKGETYIVVIGESENKHHMSLYGYFRNTTPYLDANKNIIKYTNAFSTQVYTTGVLSKALTQSDGVNKIDYLHAYSIVEIAKKAGFQTYWLTNQVLKGGWDNVISVVAHESNKLIGLNKGIGRTVSTSVYDEKLLSYLKTILLQKSKKNRLIFIHLMGNHNRYSDRYPKKFNKFHDYLDKKEFGYIADKNNITKRLNSYDNSILYNDYIVHSIIDELRDTNETGALLYFSDHSEDVENNLAHNPNKFTYAMCEIPLLVYCTKGYIKKYPQKYNNLLHNRNKLFSNAFIYDTIIGITGIKTKKYNVENDISSLKYNLDANQSYTLDGKKLYATDKNKVYIKRKNLAFINKNNIRISMKNFVSFAQLYEAYTNNIKNISLTLENYNDKLYIFNKDKKVMLFQDFVIFIKQNQMKIFLNIDFNNSIKLAYNMQKIIQIYGQNVEFDISANMLKDFFPSDALVKYIGLELDSQDVYNDILQFNRKKVEVTATFYKHILKKYHLKSILFHENLIKFIARYGLDKYVNILRIDTKKDICSSNLYIEKNLFKMKKVFYEINYCTIFSSGDEK